MHATMHHRRRVDAIRVRALSDWVPPVQLRPSGQPISVTDQFVSAVVLAVTVVVVAKATNFGISAIL